MQYRFWKTELVIITIVLFVGTSVVPCISGVFLDSNKMKLANSTDITNRNNLYEKGNNKKLQNIFNIYHSFLENISLYKISELLQSNTSIYFTITSSGMGDSEHVIIIPFCLRLIKHHGIFFLAYIFHYGVTARTTVFEFNIETKKLTLYYLEVGMHSLWIHGICFSTLDPNKEGGRGRVFCMSLIPPSIN